MEHGERGDARARFSLILALLTCFALVAGLWLAAPARQLFAEESDGTEVLEESDSGDVDGGDEEESEEDSATLSALSTEAEEEEVAEESEVLAVEAVADGLISETDWFRITPACATSCAVDISSASTSSGANAQIYTSNSTIAQSYWFEWTGGYYLIINAKSGKALGVASTTSGSGVNVAQYTKSTSDTSQLWSVHENSDGTYTFVNVATGLALSVADGASASGTNLVAETATASEAQRFTLASQAYTITEGTYTIATSLSSSVVLDVKSASGNAGANVQVYKSNSTFAQKWYIAPVDGAEGVYTIESLASAKLLTADSDGNVCQRASSGSTSQQWRAIKTAYGITFVNVAYPTKVLDVKGAKTSNGTNVQVYRANGTKAQAFTLTSSSSTLSSSTYWIQLSKSYTKVLDVKSGSTSNSANVQVYGNNGTGAQKWKITKNSDGTYTIVNCKSGKALDVKSAGTSNGTNVQQYTSNSTDAQKWYITYCPGSGYKITSALDSSLVLDVSGGKTSNGTNVQVWTSNGTAAQRFTFRATTYSASDDYSGVQLAMYKKIQSLSSSTKYLLVVDTSACRMGVFTGSKGSWSYVYYWKCTPGASSTPTVKGSYTVKSKGYSFGTSSYTCYYYTQFYGNYLFHSVLYYAGTFNVKDGRLGYNLSHGCVRLALSNAKWIYSNVPTGTKVYIY